MEGVIMLNITEKVPLPILLGEGFLLRPYRKSDVESLQRNINDKRVARDVSNIPFPYTIEHAHSWVDLMQDSVTAQSSRVDFVIDVAGEVAGSVAFINVDRHKAQVSVWVSPQYWRRNLALRALRMLVQFGFETLGLVRIYAYHYTENERTAGLLEKAGFRFEGVHEKEWLKVINGEARLYDSNYYSIVRNLSKVRSVTIATAEGTHYQHVPSLAVALREKLIAAGYEVFTADQLGDKRVDLALSLGGDGTMMKTVAHFSRLGIPTLGINAGGVGFLTSAEASELDEVVARITRSDFTIERRMSLRFMWKGEQYGPFANEVSLWHPTRGIATFAVGINGEPLFERLPGDGVLVATATGSTAYNASAGGPIITPESLNVVINALNPPMFNMRPVVTEKLAAGGTIELKVIESKHDQPLTIAADSMQIKDGLRVGETLVISRHSQPLLFATFGARQYVRALKGKMNLAQ